MNSRMWGIIGGLALVVVLLSPYVLGNSKKVAQLFEAAETLYENSDYKDAIVKYEEVLKESNKLLTRTESIDEDFTTLVNFKIAMSYVQLAEEFDDTNYYEKALEHVERADQTVKLAEYEKQLIYLWGDLLYRTGQLTQALEKLTQLIENFPNSPFEENAQETIAEINEQLRDSEEEETEKVVTPTDRIPLWINDLSKFEAFNKKKNRTLVVPNRLRAEKQYAKAAEEYEILANTNPSTTEAAYTLYWAGWCYHKAASNDDTLLSKARDVFQRLIDNQGDNPYTLKARETLRNIVDSEQKTKSTEAIIDAEEAVHRAQQSNCESDVITKAITRLSKAKQEQQEDNYASALTSANEAQAMAHSAINNHETARRYVNQGYTYLNQGRLETATHKAREALHIDPPYQNAQNLLQNIKQEYFDRGVNYIQAEEYVQAIPLLIKALNIEPFKEGYYHLGRAYLKLAEFEKAKAACKAALKIDPTYKDAKDLCDSIAD